MIKNIFANIPNKIPEEITEILMENKNIRIERIISRGQKSSTDFWYNQDENEWIMVIKGSAKLKIENEPEEITLCMGDYINIPSHLKHRIEWTNPNEETLWLAIFY